MASDVAKSTFVKLRAAVQTMVVADGSVADGSFEIVDEFNVPAVLADAKALRDTICAALRAKLISELDAPKKLLDSKIHVEELGNDKLWHYGAKTFDHLIKAAQGRLCIPANNDLKKVIGVCKKVY